MITVVGTAGHIDHGKTALLRALTGIDADRLPEERRRGMTIDVGYAHLVFDDGSMLDFVDVPGHDRLVGNMLVGAGEIDAALLVVAADDGPRAQTLEHLELLDALGIADGIAAVTKADIVDPERTREVVDVVRALLASTTLAESPTVAVSAVTGEGIDALRAELARLRDRAAARLGSGGRPPRLAVDRVFVVRGRGAVVTGSLRGGPIAAGDTLDVLPDGTRARVREVQVHGATVPAAGGGRTALLLGGVEAHELRRGQVLCADPAVVATSRILVALRPPAGLSRPVSATDGVPADRERVVVHLGTDHVPGLVVRTARESVPLANGSVTAIIRLDRPVAAAPGDRLALRRPSPPATVAGGLVLDPHPPRGVSRRRTTPDRLAALAAAAAVDPRPDPTAVRSARVALHGALGDDLAPDVEAAVRGRALAVVADAHAADASAAGVPLATVRVGLSTAVRRLVTLDRAAATRLADRLVAAMVRDGDLVRDRDRLRPAGAATGPTPAVRAAMDRLVEALETPTPPPLAATAEALGCPPDAVRRLEAERRIVRLEDDLAWATATYRRLARTALDLAARGPLSPAAYRDASGSTRRYALVVLEDLDRRGLLARTPDGHVLGPKALERARADAARADGAHARPGTPEATSR